MDTDRMRSTTPTDAPRDAPPAPTTKTIKTKPTKIKSIKIKSTKIKPTKIKPMITETKSKTKPETEIKYTKDDINDMKTFIKKTERISKSTLNRRKKAPKAANNGKQPFYEKYKTSWNALGLQRIVYYPDLANHRLLIADVKQQAADMFESYEASGDSLWFGACITSKKPVEDMTENERRVEFITHVSKDYCSWWHHQKKVASHAETLETFEGIVAEQT